MKTLRRVLPLLLFLAFYWPALTGWFFQDDFGWLRLRYDVHSAADLPAALFAPKAHGNMRPLGENAYWLALGSAFGVNALPFRIVTFATAMAALLLLGGVAQQLTKSDTAAFAAQVVWIFSRGVAPSIGWSSIYNQVLSGFFFLLAFYCLVRYVETGERRWWVFQWIAFVLGLGALETNVVYPALAAVYAALCARPLLRKIWPMFLVSALSAGIHFYFAPAPHRGPYAPRLDTLVFETLWTYWRWAFGTMPAPLIVAMTAAALAFAAHRAARRDYNALIAFAWFVIPLAPYLSLPEHKMDYYLAVPSIGIALLGAAAWRGHRTVAAGCLLCYVIASGWSAFTITRWEHERGRRVEDFVTSVAEIRRGHPGKAILLDNMDDDLFRAAMVNLPFHAMRIPEVFLAPGGTSRIDASADVLQAFVLPPELAGRLLRQDGAIVYRFDGDTLRNETTQYGGGPFPDGTPHFINIGDAIFSPYLGPGWAAAADGYRSMNGSASLRIGGGSAIYVGVVRTKPFSLHLSVNGTEAPLALVSRTDDLSLFRAAVPPDVQGKAELLLTVSSGEPLTFGFVKTE